MKSEQFQQLENKPEVQAAKEVLREAFEALLTEKNELENLARYMVARPIRTIIEGGSQARMDKASSAMQAVIDFCQKVGAEYPQKAEDVEALIERLDSPEFDEQIGTFLSQ